MSKFFVNQNDQIIIEVFVWEAEDGVDATWDKSQVPSKKNTDSIKFIFKHPNYADSTAILQQSQTGSETVNVTAFQDMVLRRLCVDWDIPLEGDEKTKLTPTNINNLHPRIARAAVDGLLQKIKF